LSATLRAELKHALFRFLGKDPEAVVVTFLSGEPHLAAGMLQEIVTLVPDRRHFAVCVGTAAVTHEGAEPVVLEPGSALSLWRQLRRRFSHLRIGLAPVLMTTEPDFRALRRAAFLLTPHRILAYNGRLERHHLRLNTPIASLLFLCGVSLDRIFLRPRWLAPWKPRHTQEPSSWRLLEGRPFMPGRRRIGVLSPYFPYPLSHGGAVRMFYLLREAAREFDIVLFAFAEGRLEQYEPVLEFCSRVVLVPRHRHDEPRWSTLAPPEAVEHESAALRRLWEGFCREFDITARQVEYTQMASYGGDILVAHDLSQDLYGQVLARSRTPSAFWNWWRWRRFEGHAMRQYRRVVVMSERDAALLPGLAVRVIANGVDIERFVPAQEPAGHRLLFIGSFRHFPNALAWRFFAEQVWPVVRARFPAVEVTVVAGADPELHWSNATGTLQMPSGPGITTLSFVSDVRPLYAETVLVVVPTLVSAGTNLKTLEAMAMERAVVATPSGCKGLGLEHGVSVWIAKDAPGLAEGIATLFEDAVLRCRIAVAARRIAVERFDWKRIGALERDLLREVSEPPLVVRRAHEEDIPELDRIQRASPEAVLWEPHSYLAYDCRVAELGGRIAGFVVVRSVMPGESEVLSLVVDPAVRRRGFGAHLMREVLGPSPETWYLEVREANWPARNLYKKLGFEEVGVRPSYYQDTGETAVVMRLKPC